VSVRFQADNDLNATIVTAVKRYEPAVDFCSAREARLDGLPDPELLDLTAAEGRVLVSHDQNTMLAHFRDRLRKGKSSPGLLLVSQSAAIREVVEALLYVWALFDPEDLLDQVYYLPSLSQHLFTH
jgi:hypothetical protein